MAASVAVIWIIALAGAIMLDELVVRARLVRLDPAATVVAAALAGLACVTAASFSMAPGW
jgi:hypothetical protein